MSNPGVICLAENVTCSGNVIRVEDNIGEAIHIHYNDIRIDLSILEFINIVNTCVSVVDDLIDVDGFSIKLLEPMFFAGIARYLVDLERVEIVNVKLNKLLIENVNGIGLPVIRPIKHSKVVKALQGKPDELKRFSQENLFGVTNEERLENMYKKIKIYGYPYKKEYIVLFNGQNIIRDGQHRAACLYHIMGGGNINIPILRLHFKKDMHNLSFHPWITYLFRWDKKKVKKNIRKIINKLATSKILLRCRKIIERRLKNKIIIG